MVIGQIRDSIVKLYEVVDTSLWEMARHCYLLQELQGIISTRMLSINCGCMRIASFPKVWERRMNGIYVPKASFFHHLASLKLGEEESVNILRKSVEEGWDDIAMLIRSGECKGSDKYDAKS